MKRVLVSVVVMLAAQLSSAQSASLTAPVARTSEASFVVDKLALQRTPAQAVIEIMVQDSGGVEDIKRVNYVVPDAAHPGATVVGLVTAMMTVRATETGTNPRKLNFRVLGYLADQGYFPAHTLVP
jgi:hypothetical protein